MDKERVLHEERIAGAEADQLRSFKAWVRAVEHTEAEIVRQLKTVGIKDKELQADLVRSLQLLGILTKFIEQASDSGKMAALELEQKGKFARLFR